jgi:hypothetical protein
MLRFSEANAKTQRLRQVLPLVKYLTGNKKVYSLDLLAGKTCPGASLCHSWRGKNGKIVDGPHCQFRCFSASQEVTFPAVYRLRKHNTDLLTKASKKGSSAVITLLVNSLPKDAGIVRFHVSGDIFSVNYYIGLISLAYQTPDTLFYFYTKSYHIVDSVTADDPQNGVIMPNLICTMSLGGIWDDWAIKAGWRTAKVVYSESEAGNLPIDHDDSHAALPGGSFALLLHGIQPPKTAASRAWQVIRKTVGGYKK